MNAKTSLLISTGCFFLLGFFVLVTLWLTPDVLSYSDNVLAMNVAKGWGDVNAMLFICLALIWFLSSSLESIDAKKTILISNFIICVIMLSTAIFHHLVPSISGPPPPVFILLTISGVSAFYSWKKGL